MEDREETIFDKIINGKAPAEKVYDSEKVLAIKDIFPKAPVHLLIMPKKHIPNIHSVKEEDFPIICEIITVIQKLAKQFGIQDCYRILANNELPAGETIYHLHFHLLGGVPLTSIKD